MGMNLTKCVLGGLMMGLLTIPSGVAAAADAPTADTVRKTQEIVAAAKQDMDRNADAHSVHPTDPISRLEQTLPAKTYSLKLNTRDYQVKTLQVGAQSVAVRVYADRVYVAKPADADYEKMTIYVPEAYFQGQSINGYTAKTAPIFLPNGVGGYMPGTSVVPGEDERHGGANAAFTALSKGYVVAAPAIRGRSLQAADGSYTGKAPALIVDYKAAVRYLRYNQERLPAGDTEKIISDGTSAGGALSALLGATGNSSDYAAYLKELGAADARDDIFASAVYCPITNLEHADMAYEWVFNGVHDYHQRQMPGGGMAKPADAQGTMMPSSIKVGDKTIPLGPGPVILSQNSPAGQALAGGRPANAPAETDAAAQLSEAQIAASADLKGQFPAYVNSLGLRDSQGRLLTLDADGNGTFREYIASLYRTSAQSALDAGQDLSGLDWLTVENGQVTGVDLAKYAVYATRLKAVPAFDAFDLSSGENDEFGTTMLSAQHFTDYAAQNSTVSAAMADEAIIRLLNPMNYIGDSAVRTAPYWRIRHGAVDRDTSLAVPAMLALKLADAGCQVDFSSPWNRGHDGDYDLDALFDWTDHLCKAK